MGFNSGFKGLNFREAKHNSSDVQHLYLCVCVCVLARARVFYFPLLVVMWRNLTLERRDSRSQWPSNLRRRSVVERLQRLWVRIPLGAWMSVRCECCVLSGRGLCVGLITRPEESYRLWCVVVCGLETSWMRRPWATGGMLRQKKRSDKNFSWVLF